MSAPRFAYRSSITGEFVTKEKALANPWTTYKDELHDGENAPPECLADPEPPLNDPDGGVSE